MQWQQRSDTYSYTQKNNCYKVRCYRGLKMSDALYDSVVNLTGTGLDWWVAELGIQESSLPESLELPVESKPFLDQPPDSRISQFFSSDLPVLGSPTLWPRRDSPALFSTKTSPTALCNKRRPSHLGASRVPDVLADMFPEQVLQKCSTREASECQSSSTISEEHCRPQELTCKDEKVKKGPAVVRNSDENPVCVHQDPGEQLVEDLRCQALQVARASCELVRSTFQAQNQGVVPAAADRRRLGKRRSAHKSRTMSRVYEAILEQHVEASEKQLAELRRWNDEQRSRNVLIQGLLARLEKSGNEGDKQAKVSLSSAVLNSFVQ